MQLLRCGWRLQVSNERKPGCPLRVAETNTYISWTQEGFEGGFPIEAVQVSVGKSEIQAKNRSYRPKVRVTTVDNQFPDRMTQNRCMNEFWFF